MKTLVLLALLTSSPSRDYVISGVTSPVTTDLTFNDDIQLRFGTGDDNTLVYDTVQTPDALLLGLGTDSERFILAPKSCVGSTDFGLADAGTPTLSLSDAGCTAVLSLAEGAITGDVTWTGEVKLTSNIWATIAYIGGTDLANVDYIWRPSGNKLAISRGNGTGLTALQIDSLELLGNSRFINSGTQRNGIHFSKFSQSTFNLGTGHNNHISFVQYSYGGQDYLHGLQTNPTVFFHSATSPATATDEWISLTHDVTDGIVDVGSGVIRMKDGVTVEGALTTDAGRIVQHTAVADVAYTPLDTDHIIGYTSLTAARIVDPQDATCVDGRVYTVKDQAGTAGSNTITIDPEGGTFIDGVTTATITTNYGSISFYCDGSAWYTY